MKIYKNVFVSEKKIVDVICNMCGEKIEKIDDDVLHDYFQAKKEWGYFSDIDGEKHSFDLCQNCYKKLISQFKISAADDREYEEYQEYERKKKITTEKKLLFSA